ncbi:MAG: elongation factor G, partial [Actinobacteria bacterium]|nr:elongation factor G [Actinomycetota bacterium]
MGAPSTEKVRNIVLVGQDGAGKTSLAEAMLFLTGRTTRMGTTHDGKSNLDYDSEEIKRRFTISTAIAPVRYKDFKINVLDTSGYPDFMGDTIAAMYAAEMALFVVDAVAGPQIMTKKLWFTAGKVGIAKSVFINHIDREHANFENAMATLSERFGKRLGAVTIPIGVDVDFKGVIDIIRMKARYFIDGGEIIDVIPAEFEDAANEARDVLCELVAEADDEIMAKYLDGEAITQEELEMLLGKAIAQGIFIPVFVGSTLIEQGIAGLLDDIVTYFPAPDIKSPYVLENGEALDIDSSGVPAGLVFKTVSDPYVGRLSFIKVLSGTLEPGMELINSRTGRKDRLAHLYLMCGKETTDVKSAGAGDIIIVPKLSETGTGDTLSLNGRITIPPLPFPKPLYPVAIEASNKKDEDKLGDFLAKAVEIDPTITMHRDEETHQTLLTGLG